MSEKMLDLSFDEFQKPNYEDWREAAEKSLKGAPFDKLMYTKTYEGITLNPIYNQEDIAHIEYLNTVPGSFPFLRGTSELGYKAKAWDVAQDIEIADPTEFNKSLKYDLERGQTAVKINMASACKASTDIYTVEDFEKALNGVDIEKYPLFITAGSRGIEAAILLIAYCKKNNINTDNLRGAIDIDPYGASLKGGKSHKFENVAKITNWAVNNAPMLSVITASGMPFANAGASATQELAYTIANATEYLRKLSEYGLSIDDIAKKIRFTFSIGPKFFTEIAKLRAAKMLWAKIVKSFGGNENSQKMKIHAQGSMVYKSELDPYVNMLRTTSESFSAAVGGVNSMTATPFDAGMKANDTFSRRISRNVQLMLQEELHLTEVIDPAGGSYYIEALTNQIAEKAWEMFTEIEKNGGMTDALKAGSVQSAIEEVKNARLNALASRKDVILGTNKYANIDENRIEKKYDKKAPLKESGKDLSALKSEFKLDLAIDSAVAGANILDLDLAIEEDKEIAKFQSMEKFRAAKTFVEMRDKALKFKEENGEYPTTYMVNFGHVRNWKARADFSLDFFQVAAFRAEFSKGFDSVDEAVKDAIEKDAPIYVICSSDDLYPEYVPGFAKALKEAKPNAKIVLAGYPKDYIDQFKEAGVDEFIHVKANIVDILSNMQAAIGL